MSLQVDFRVLELLCARLCHELVSPVGAINNGVELMGEDDPGFVKEAMALIGQSARKAGQRLQFYRFAYGVAGNATTGAGTAPGGRELAIGLLEGGKVRCDWGVEATTLPLDCQRLACNMLVLAADMLPRGGKVIVRPLPSGLSGLEVAAEGNSINLAAEIRAALEDGVAVDMLTPRTVHAYFTACLAQQIGARLVLSQPDPGRAVLTAVVADGD